MIVKKTRKGYYVFKRIKNMGRKRSTEVKMTNIHVVKETMYGHRIIRVEQISFPIELLGTKIRFKIEVVK